MEPIDQAQLALASAEALVKQLRGFVAALGAMPVPVPFTPSARPTSDAPEQPGKKRRACAGCNTKQYGIRDGRCEACRALDKVTLSDVVGS